MAGFLNFKRNVNYMRKNPDNGVLQTIGINKTQLIVPNLIGLTSAAAQSAILAAGYFVGTITLTVGNVTAQSMVAGTKTVVHSKINITLTS